MEYCESLKYFCFNRLVVSLPVDSLIQCFFHVELIFCQASFVNEVRVTEGWIFRIWFFPSSKQYYDLQFIKTNQVLSLIIQCSILKRCIFPVAKNWMYWLMMCNNSLSPKPKSCVCVSNITKKVILCFWQYHKFKNLGRCHPSWTFLLFLLFSWIKIVKSRFHSSKLSAQLFSKEPY